MARLIFRSLPRQMIPRLELPLSLLYLVILFSWCWGRCTVLLWQHLYCTKTLNLSATQNVSVSAYVHTKSTRLGYCSIYQGGSFSHPRTGSSATSSLQRVACPRVRRLKLHNYLHTYTYTHLHTPIHTVGEGMWEIFLFWQHEQKTRVWRPCGWDGPWQRFREEKRQFVSRHPFFFSPSSLSPPSPPFPPFLQDWRERERAEHWESRISFAREWDRKWVALTTHANTMVSAPFFGSISPLHSVGIVLCTRRTKYTISRLVLPPPDSSLSFSLMNPLCSQVVPPDCLTISVWCLVCWRFGCLAG